MLQAKQLTDKTFMIRDTKLEKSLGMVTLRDEKYYLLGVKEPFNSLEDIATHFGGKLAVTQEEVEAELVSDINGYPIKHRTACCLETKEINGVTIETYKVSENSRKVYAAGYFGLMFKNGLACGIGVMFQTLVDNGFIGPFKSEMDMEFKAKEYKNRDELSLIKDDSEE